MSEVIPPKEVKTSDNREQSADTPITSKKKEMLNKLTHRSSRPITNDGLNPSDIYTIQTNDSKEKSNKTNIMIEKNNIGAGIPEAQNTPLVYNHTMEHEISPAKVKKATFELDTKLHKELKLQSVKQNKNMVVLASDAILFYLSSELPLPKYVNDTGRVKKKTTFELDTNLHYNLKLQAAMEERDMVALVEDAIYNYFLLKR